MTVAKKRKAATRLERANEFAVSLAGATALRDQRICLRVGWLAGYRAAQRDQRKARAGKGRK